MKPVESGSLTQETRQRETHTGGNLVETGGNRQGAERQSGEGNMLGGKLPRGRRVEFQNKRGSHKPDEANVSLAWQN